MPTLTCVYETHPISTHSLTAVPRLLGQVLEWRATQTPSAVVAVCPAGGAVPGVRVIEVALNQSERFLSRAFNNRLTYRFIPGGPWLDRKGMLRRKAIRRLRNSEVATTVFLCATAPMAYALRGQWPESKIILWVHSPADPATAERVRAGFNAADALVTTRAMYHFFWKMLSHDLVGPPLWLIPYPVDPQVFSGADDRQACRAEFGLAPEDFAIAHIGRAAIKGLHVIAEALQLMRAPGRPIKLLSAGTQGGPATKFANGTTLIEVGRLTPSHLSRFYQACDLGVVPSLWFECYPLAVLEMMASGLCTVASRSGGIEDMIKHGETGLLVDNPNEVELWAATLCRIMAADELRLGIAKRGQEVVRRDSSPQQIFQKWAKLLNHIGNPDG